MDKETKLFFDVTQLVHWSGRITGIPRVMEELALRYHRERPDTVFVSWVKEIREFCEIDLAATLAQRGNGIVYLRPGQIAPAKLVQPQMAAPAVSGRQLVRRALKSSLRHASRVSPRLAERAQHRLLLASLQRYKRAVFSQGDQLFIPWGEWWDPMFITRLEGWNKQGVKLIPVIHDIGPMTVPQLSGHSTDSLTAYCKAIVPISALTIVVSEYTKKHLSEWLRQHKLHVPTIKVMRNGDDFTFSKARLPDDPAFRASGLKGGDFIMCGAATIEIKKNHLLLYYVYKLAQSRGIKLPKLLVVGRLGWKSELFYDLVTQDPTTNQEIIPLLNISDEELSWLYDHCMFTIFPSFDEGWGIPIAESVARGVPCLCSNTSSMTEIAEGFVEHFNPASTDECLAGIQRWLDPKKLAAARAKVARYKQYSWDDSFAQADKYVKETK